MHIPFPNWQRKSTAKCLLIGVPLFVMGQCFAEDPSGGKGKKGASVPAYVSTHFDKAKVRLVHGAKAVVRSGPSDKYYTTSSLQKGAAVDVYMETSDGWSAIRPPAGSHNWIPANVAYLLPGGKSAEITTDKSPAWVGSESSDMSELMWQMELVKSQQVQVLGEEVQLTEEGKKQLWYRIAPPPGEFRWVKTSQLSDSLPASATGTGVQLANYVEDNPASVPTENNNGESGRVVWSDEKKAVEEVEAQIRREQAEAQGTVDGDAAPITSTRIRPIAQSPSQHPKRAKRSNVSAEHQLDGDRQWEAMQSADPKLRIKPMKSLLGLIGFSIIETERAPVSTQISQQYHTNAGAGNLGHIGPIGNSRLDRLPRPGNRPSMMSPADGSETLSFPMGSSGMDPIGWNGAPGMSGSATPQTAASTMHSGESTFSKWINSREPVFGSPNAGSQSTLAAQDSYARLNAPQGQSVPNELEPSAWHGLSNSQRSLNAPSSGESLGSQYLDSGRAGDRRDGGDGAYEIDEFRTPEIQSALVHLTREVAGPTEQWNFTALKSQAASWIENGESILVRGEARLLMERIERFESLRQRALGFAQQTSMLAQQAIGNSASNAIRQASSLAPAAGFPAFSNGTGSDVTRAVANSTANQGDASGWLVQVHTTTKGQPEFALTDDAGKVIAYVQSYPSVNLRSYLQQPVTVYGVRGYIPNLAAKQILAERVVRMR